MNNYFRDRYQRLEVLGRGTYGKAFSVNDKWTHEKMAVKKLKHDPDGEGLRQDSIREAIALTRCAQLANHHDHIVSLKNVIIDDSSMQLVMECFPMSLGGYLKANNKIGFRNDHARFWRIASKIVDAVSFCHKVHIIHRDLKPQNILFDPNTDSIRICDFGLCRLSLMRSAVLLLSSDDADSTADVSTSESKSAIVDGAPFCWKDHKEDEMTTHLVTLWYRSPEVASFGESSMRAIFDSTAIDVWSVGCVVYETFVGEPIFRASEEFDILIAIFKRLGRPSLNIVSKFYSPRFDINTFKKWQTPQPEEERFGIVKEESELLFDILNNHLLTLNPDDRNLFSTQELIKKAQEIET